MAANKSLVLLQPLKHDRLPAGSDAVAALGWYALPLQLLLHPGPAGTAVPGRRQGIHSGAILNMQPPPAAIFPIAAPADAGDWHANSHFGQLMPPLAVSRQELRAEYGPDAVGWYSADTFNENVPPSSDPAYLRATSAAIYKVWEPW